MPAVGGIESGPGGMALAVCAKTSALPQARRLPGSSYFGSRILVGQGGRTIKPQRVKLNCNLNITTLTRVVIFSAFYFVGGLLGKKASFQSGNVTLVWPHAGIRRRA